MIRVSGPASRSALVGLLKDPRRRISPRRLHYLELTDSDGRVLDRVMAAWLPGPDNFTGEDSVEIYAHGGAMSARGILAALEKQGVRAAHAGEFTYRAFLNGRMDLIQAEAVAELIHSRSEAARRLALGHLAGSLGEVLSPLKEGLHTLLRDLELGIDFVEEDLDFVSRDEIISGVEQLAATAGKLLEGAGQGRLIREGVEVVLVGAPNAGKSSLFNALLAEERAIVTSEPGTTRDVLRESWLNQGVVFHLNDTAGLRPVTGEVEALGVQRSEALLDAAALNLWIIDGSSVPGRDERRRLSGMDPLRSLVVANKSDLDGYDMERCRAMIPQGVTVLSVSALEGDGLDALREALFKLAVEELPQVELETRVALNRRQESRLREMNRRLGQLSRAGIRNMETEILAGELRKALAELEELTGDRVGEALLEEIFSNFCIGK